MMSQPNHATPAMPADFFTDPVQTAEWRALAAKKISRQSVLIQQHYQEQRPGVRPSASHREQLCHIIELNFYQRQDWASVIACVLSGDETMQRSANLERWGALLTLAVQAARHLGDGAAEAELTLRMGALRRRQGQLSAAAACLTTAENLWTQLGLHAHLPKVWRRQAEQWISQGSYGAALERLVRAESHMDPLASPDDRIDLYYTWGLLANAQGDPQAAIGWYEKALTVAGDSEPMMSRAQRAAVQSYIGTVHERLGHIYCTVGNYEAALNQLAAAQRLAEAEDNDGDLGRILSLIGTVWGMRGQLQRSIDYFQQVWEVAERCAHPAMAMTAHANLAVSYYRLGQFNAALHAVRHALRWANGHDHPRVRLNSLITECEILCALAQPSAAQASLTAAETLLTSLEYTPDLTAFVTGARGRLARLMGDNASAIHHFLAAIALMQATENRFETAEFAIELVPLYLAQQHWAEAERWIALIRTLGHELQQCELIGQAETLTGDLAYEQGKAAAAQAAYDAALAAFQSEANDRNRYLAAQLSERLHLLLPQ